MRSAIPLIACAVLFVTAGAVEAGDEPAKRVETLAFAPLEETVTPQITTTAPPPVPRHTGLRAVLYMTAADFRSLPKRRSTWVILGIGGALAAATHPVDVEVNRRLQGSSGADRFFKVGKFVGSGEVQIGSAIGLYLYGRYFLPPLEGESRNNKVSHLGFDMVRALIITQAVTLGVKQTVRRDRPTGECCSFPSGHSANAFTTAAVLERHLGYRAAWPTLIIATYVASSRLNTNRHFLSDVLFGAGVGTAAGWTVVGRHGRSSYTLVPAPIRGGMAFWIVRQPPES